MSNKLRELSPSPSNPCIVRAKLVLQLVCSQKRRGGCGEHMVKMEQDMVPMPDSDFVPEGLPLNLPTRGSSPS